MRILIIGQGFAGSLLAWSLVREGVSVLVADTPGSTSATRVSAGILNPITGKKLRVPYHSKTFIPLAIEMYEELARDTGVPVFNRNPVLHVFQSPGNRNDWFAYSGMEEYRDYCGDFIEPEQLPISLVAPFGAIGLRQSGWVHTGWLIDSVRAWLLERQAFIEGNITFNDLTFKDSTVTWNGSSFDYVVFCDGYKAWKNHLFSYVPFHPAKGEIMDIHCPDLPRDHIVINGVYIVPVEPDLFRVGATFTWEAENDKPTAEGRNQLETDLRRAIRLPYTVKQHLAGIRPAIADRRPVIGYHPEFTRAIIFNGLGTKGTLMGPAGAFITRDLLLKSTRPDPVLDVSRFSRLYPGFRPQ